MKFLKEAKIVKIETLDQITPGTPFYHTHYDKSGAETTLYMKTSKTEKVEKEVRVVVVRLGDGYLTTLPKTAQIDKADVYLVNADDEPENDR